MAFVPNLEATLYRNATSGRLAAYRGVNVIKKIVLVSQELKMSTHAEHRRTPLLLWPFVAVWRLLAFIIEMTGRLVGAILGLVLLIVGIVVSLTVIGAIVGVPLALLGLLLMVRCIF